MSEQNEKTRAFIAVDLPEEIKSKILETSSTLDPVALRAVGSDQLHITLFFLDNVDGRQIDGVKSALSKLDERRFEVSLGGVGTFDISRPRVLFANVTKGYENLLGVYSRLFGDLEVLRIKMEDREFSPHVTIARLKHAGPKEIGAARKAVEDFARKEFGGFVCSSIKLKRSELTSKGPIYTDLFVKELTA